MRYTIVYPLLLILFVNSCAPKDENTSSYNHNPEDDLKNELAIALAEQEPTECSEAVTTLEMTECAGDSLNNHHTIMESYLSEIYVRYSYDEELVQEIKQSQEKWLDYMSSHCKSVYALWRHGSVRNLMAVGCENEMIKKRTIELWETFLVGGDGSAILPKPAFQ